MVKRQRQTIIRNRLILGGKNNGQKTETDNNQKPLIEGGQNNGQKTETDNNQKPLIEGGQNNGQKTDKQ